MRPYSSIFRFIFISLASIAFLTSPAYATAKRTCCYDGDKPKWYAAIRGSVVFLEDVDISTSPNLGEDKMTFDPGYGIGAAVGYKVLSGVRLEFEVLHRQNELDESPATTQQLEPGTFAAQRSLALMANAYIDLHNETSYTPYFGVGAGYARIKNPRKYTYNPTGETIELEEWVLAYQFMTGVNYKIRNSPFEVSFGYRYFTGQDAEKKVNIAGDPLEARFGNTSDNLDLGLQFNF